MTNRLVLELDEDDYRDIQREITRRQVRSRVALGEPLTESLPDGESNLAGAVLAEVVRDLWEYHGRP
jgi:hypothetical protein